MTVARVRRLCLAAALFFLPACAAQGPFPSLAPRPAEREDLLDEPVREIVPVAPDPALRAQAAELLALARAGAADFEAVYPTALAAARGAGALETESWVLAQQALSRLQSARGETMRALAALDLLAIGRAVEPTNAEDFAAILAALEAVDAIAAGQETRIDTVRATISPA